MGDLAANDSSLAAEQECELAQQVVPADRRTRCEVYSRVVGYLRPVQQWNKGKRQEYRDRETFRMPAADQG